MKTSLKQTEPMSDFKHPNSTHVQSTEPPEPARYLGQNEIV